MLIIKVVYFVYNNPDLFGKLQNMSKKCSATMYNVKELYTKRGGRSVSGYFTSITETKPIIISEF